MRMESIVDKEEAINVYNNIEIMHAPFFSLKGIKSYARILDVYDGDTLTIAIKLYGTILKFRCRLYGIDTCEITSKHPICKDLALKARQRLIELISNKECPIFKEKKEIIDYFTREIAIVWIHCNEQDKYGRVLINVFANPSSSESFSDKLIKERLAYSYMGETKLSEEKQVAQLIL
jgi:endonuclease YncB( thermonuclease family)